jgi:hypothetical protein
MYNIRPAHLLSNNITIPAGTAPNYALPTPNPFPSNLVGGKKERFGKKGRTQSQRKKESKRRNKTLKMRKDRKSRKQYRKMRSTPFHK